MFTLSGITLSAIMTVLSPVFFIIGFIASWFVTIGGSLTNWALDLNSMVLQSPTVKIGWTVSRDIANLGFVLAIILIAFATILRFENYGMKKALSKLIIAALLINFSLVIAGVFMDFSGVLTNFFIDKATNYDSAQLGAGLANAFKVQTILQPKSDLAEIQNQIQGMDEDFNGYVTFITSQAFITIFTAIVAISLMSLAAMLYIRYIALTILLVLAPLAWLFSIWPDLEGYWKQWWSEFLRWTFFAPAMTFFIYLALSIATKQSGAAPVIADLNDKAFTTGLLIKDWGTILGQMISMVGILYGGMYAANKMGIQGAAAGISAVTGLKTAIATGSLATLGLGTFGLGRGYEKFRGGKSVSDDLQTLTAKGSRLPLVGGLMLNANRALVGGEEKRLDEYKKKYKEVDEDALINRFKQDPMLMPEEERSAMMAIISEKPGVRKKLLGLVGKPGGISADHYDSFVKSAVYRGGETAKTVIATNPIYAKFKVNRSEFASDAAGETAYQAKIKEEIGRAFDFIKTETAATMDVEVFKGNPGYMNRLKGNWLVEFGNSRSYKDKADFKKYLEDELRTIQKSLSAGTPLSDENRKLINVAKIINSSSKKTSIGWTGATITQTLIPKI